MILSLTGQPLSPLNEDRDLLIIPTGPVILPVPVTGPRLALQ